MCPIVLIPLLLLSVKCDPEINTVTSLNSTNTVQYFNMPSTTPNVNDEFGTSFERYNQQMDERENNPYYRVVGAKKAKHGEVPYMVGFRKPLKGGYVYKTFCGGAIINEKSVLTAAHCFKEFRVLSLSTCVRGYIGARQLIKVFAVAGSLRTSDRFYDFNRHGQWRELRHVRYPQRYSFPWRNIAVVALSKKFTFNANVQPINYATQFQEFRSPCVASGYGLTASTANETAEPSKFLMVAELIIIPYKRCSILQVRDMKNFVCTQHAVADVTKGDDGGPLVCRRTGKSIEGQYGLLVGIASGLYNRKFHDQALAESTFFTRASAYAKFVGSDTIGLSMHKKVKASLLIIFLNVYVL